MKGTPPSLSIGFPVFWQDPRKNDEWQSSVDNSRLDLPPRIFVAGAIFVSFSGFVSFLYPEEEQTYTLPAGTFESIIFRTSPSGIC